MLKESSVKGWVRRMIRSVFIAPNCAVTLAMELEREIQLFHVSDSTSCRVVKVSSHSSLRRLSNHVFSVLRAPSMTER